MSGKVRESRRTVSLAVALEPGQVAHGGQAVLTLFQKRTYTQELVELTACERASCENRNALFQATQAIPFLTRPGLERPLREERFSQGSTFSIINA